MQKGRYPLLSALDDYKELTTLENDIDTKLQEYRQKYKKVLDNILSNILEWKWNDPVSLLYAEIFNDTTIVELSISQEEIEKDLEKRQQNNLPPGYKDRSKDDNGIGDLLIWHTILEIGKIRRKSVIFVSGDEKSDWYQRSEGRALYPRYELIDEFRRYSEGETFHILKFSGLLELFGASDKIIQDVRDEESVLSQGYGNEEIILSDIDPERIENIDAVYSWIKSGYKGGQVIQHDENFYGLYELTVESEFSDFHIDIRKNINIRRELQDIIKVNINALKAMNNSDQSVIILVYDKRSEIDIVIKTINKMFSQKEIELPSFVDIVVGYLELPFPVFKFIAAFPNNDPNLLFISPF